MKKRVWTVLLSVMVAACMCIGFAACKDKGNEKEKTALPTPLGVKLEGDIFSWNAVTGGEGYTVKINGDETTIVKNKTSLDLKTVASKLVLGENTLAVKANETEDHLESLYSATVRYTYRATLSAPANLRIEEDTLRWDAVENATAYKVKFGEEEFNATGTSYNLASLQEKFTLGENELSVKALGTGSYTDSAYSAAVKYTYRTPYGAPENLELAGSLLTWDAVETAASYTVKIGEDETTIVETNSVDLSLYAEKLALGENELSVRANANEAQYRLDGEYSESVTYIHTEPLEAPANVRVEGNTLLWDAVEDAIGYVVKLGNEEIPATGTSLDITSITSKLSLGENAFTVKALGGYDTEGYYTDSVYSAAATYIYRTAYEVPANLAAGNFSLDGAFALTWDEVETATSYTVKINDETLVVDTNMLDLLTVTDKLMLDNTVSVKANANEGAYRLESAYTATINVHYNAEAIAEAKEYVAKVEAVDTLTGDNTQDEAAMIKSALDVAAASYEALSEEAKGLVTAVKAIYDGKAEAYTNGMATATQAHEAFAALVASAQEEAEKEESVSALEFKLGAATEAKAALNTLATDLVQEAETTALETLAATLAGWKAEVAAAVAELTVELPVLDPENDATAEDILVGTKAPLEAYAGYTKEYVKSDAEVDALYTSLSSAKDAAVSQLDASVAALKLAADAALENKDVATKENYAALIYVRDMAEGFGAYASALYENYRAEEIAEAIEEMPKKIAGMEEHRTVIMNPNGALNAYIVIVHRYYNVLDEELKLEELPVTATEQVGEGAAREIGNATVVYNESYGTYTITIPFERVTQNTNPHTIVYKIADLAEVSLTLGKPSGINYFEKETKDPYYDNGQLTISGGDSKTLIDIYNADDIEMGDNIDADISFKGLPLFAGLLASDYGTPSKLRTLLAENGFMGETLNLRFVAYKYTEGADYITVSGINNASVSGVVTALPTLDDMRLDVFHLPLNSKTSFNWQLYKDNGTQIDYAWEILGSASTPAPYWDDFKIYFYDASGLSEEEIQTHDFMEDTPVYTHVQAKRDYINWKDIYPTLIEYVLPQFKAGTTSAVPFVAAIQVTPNEAGKEAGYIESLLNYATVNKNGVTRETKVFTPADFKPSNKAQIRFSVNVDKETGAVTGGSFLPARTGDNALYPDGNGGAVFESGVVEYIEVKLVNNEDPTQELYAYIVKEDNDLWMYLDLEAREDGLKFDGGYTNSYISFSSVNSWFRTRFGLINTEYTLNFKFYEWTFYTRSHVFAEYEGLFEDGDWSDGVVWTYDTYPPLGF